MSGRYESIQCIKPTENILREFGALIYVEDLV